MISEVKTLKELKNIESPKKVSKRLYGHYLGSYEQIKKNRILTTILSWSKNVILAAVSSKKEELAPNRVNPYLIHISNYLQTNYSAWISL